MLVPRLIYAFAIGLTLGCALLLAPARRVQIVPQIAPHISIELPPSIALAHEHSLAPTLGAPTIIDVAPGITAAQLALAIRLAPEEYVVGVDGVQVQSDLDAGVQLASLDRQSRRYLDLQVRGPAGERRVVVLMH